MANVILVAGMGFGDEGKGSVTDYLVREHKVGLVCRYNGGCQAAHSVVLEDGRHHTFHQFGSGTFVPGCRTHLSRFMLVQPANLLAEAAELESKGIDRTTDLVTVDDSAPITTLFHAAVNRIREQVRNKGRHGSCGMGIGETVVDLLTLGGSTLFAGDLRSPETLRAKLHMLQDINRMKVEALDPAGFDTWEWLTSPDFVEAEAQACEDFAKRVQIVSGDWLDEQIEGEGTILFEGAQGVLLDQFAGFMPWCTRSTTSFANARTLLSGHDVPVTRMGVIRSYLTRHGAGPMPTEDPDLRIPEEHNGYGPWQQNFRVGHFDMVLFQYALQALSGVDEIVVTHMDRRPNPQMVCMGYDSPAASLMVPDDLPGQFRLGELLSKAQPIYGPNCYDLIEAIEGEARTPVTLLSYGPMARDKAKRSRRAA